MIPQKTAHDKHIYKFLMKSRPQSGMKMQSNKDEALDVKTPQVANTPARQKSKARRGVSPGMGRAASPTMQKRPESPGESSMMSFRSSRYSQWSGHDKPAEEQVD